MCTTYIQSPDTSSMVSEETADASILYTSRQEDAVEELQAVFHQERSRYYPNKLFDYFSLDEQKHQDAQSSSSSERVSDNWRRKICEWLFEVVDHFRFDREVVSIALYYLDRVVSIKSQRQGKALHRREYQLIAVTSLYLAIKLHGEIQPEGSNGEWPLRRKLRVEVFVQLSRGIFTVQELEAKEREILQLLNWHVNPTSAARIVIMLLRLFPERYTTASHYDENIHNETHSTRLMVNTISEMATYLTELAVCVSDVCFDYKPSEIAYASILCALDALEGKMHIPRGLKQDYLHCATTCTGLTLSNLATLRSLLKEICPVMFESLVNEDNAVTKATSRHGGYSDEIMKDAGKVSPVCVGAQCRMGY